MLFVWTVEAGEAGNFRGVLSRGEGRKKFAKL
jgi:hypothetical protein